MKTRCPLCEKEDVEIIPVDENFLTPNEPECTIWVYEFHHHGEDICPLAAKPVTLTETSQLIS